MNKDNKTPLRDLFEKTNFNDVKDSIIPSLRDFLIKFNSVPILTGH